MNICDYGHEEIVHNEGSCPLCSAKVTIIATAKMFQAELREKLAKAEKEIEFLQRRDAGND